MLTYFLGLIGKIHEYTKTPQFQSNFELPFSSKLFSDYGPSEVLNSPGTKASNAYLKLTRINQNSQM